MARFRFPSFEPNSLSALQRELDRAFQTPRLGFGFGNPMRGVFPAVNVFDDRGSYVVRMEAAGVAPAELKVETHGRTLTISGTRPRKSGEGASFHRRERDEGSFSRSFQLPEDGDSGAAEASYEHGILTVTIPKHEVSKPRQIMVKAA